MVIAIRETASFPLGSPSALRWSASCFTDDRVLAFRGSIQTPKLLHEMSSFFVDCVNTVYTDVKRILETSQSALLDPIPKGYW